VKRGRSLSLLVGTISNVLVMEIGWTDVGSGGYILVSCAHSNTSLVRFIFAQSFFSFLCNGCRQLSFCPFLFLAIVASVLPIIASEYPLISSNLSCKSKIRKNNV
jgi:hypothetical protein